MHIKAETVLQILLDKKIKLLTFFWEFRLLVRPDGQLKVSL